MFAFSIFPPGVIFLKSYGASGQPSGCRGAGGLAISEEGLERLPSVVMSQPPPLPG